MTLGQNVFFIHLENYWYVIAERHSEVHYKMAKLKLDGQICDIEIQWMYVKRVFLPMYIGKQSHLETMEDALNFANIDNVWMMWNPNYLIDIK